MSPFKDVIRTAKKVIDERQIEVQQITFPDRRVIIVKMNGEFDTTFDVKAPRSASFNTIGDGNSGEFTCDKSCMVGDSQNYKISVLTNQIAKLVFMRHDEALTISLSSKLFNHSRGSDRDILLNVLELMGSIL